MRGNNDPINYTRRTVSHPPEPEGSSGCHLPTHRQALPAARVPPCGSHRSCHSQIPARLPNPGTAALGAGRAPPRGGLARGAEPGAGCARAGAAAVLGLKGRPSRCNYLGQRLTRLTLQSEVSPRRWPCQAAGLAGQAGIFH